VFARGWKINGGKTMLLIAKLIIDAICGVLNAIGGYCWLAARRYIMPCMIAIGVSLQSGTWWLGFTVLPVMGTLCLGYFGKGFLGRGLWLFVQAVVIAAGSTITNHLMWYFALPYVIGAFLLGGLLYDIEQFVGDFIFGCWLSIIIFLLH